MSSGPAEGVEPGQNVTYGIAVFGPDSPFVAAFHEPPRAPCF